MHVYTFITTNQSSYRGFVDSLCCLAMTTAARQIADLYHSITAAAVVNTNAFALILQIQLSLSSWAS